MNFFLSVPRPGRSGSWGGGGSLDCGPYSGTMLGLNFEFLFNLTGSKGLRLCSCSTCGQLAPGCAALLQANPRGSGLLTLSRFVV